MINFRVWACTLSPLSSTAKHSQILLVDQFFSRFGRWSLYHSHGLVFLAVQAEAENSSIGDSVTHSLTNDKLDHALCKTHIFRLGADGWKISLMEFVVEMFLVEKFWWKIWVGICWWKIWEEVPYLIYMVCVSLYLYLPLSWSLISFVFVCVCVSMSLY